MENKNHFGISDEMAKEMVEKSYSVCMGCPEDDMVTMVSMIIEAGKDYNREQFAFFAAGIGFTLGATKVSMDIYRSMEGTINEKNKMVEELQNKSNDLTNE